MVNILVVEDEQSITKLLEETLQIEGYQVTIVLNGEDAVQFALREIPHLIILDVMLPRRYGLSDMDGYDVILKLRSHPKTMHIPIIVLSAFGAPADIIRAYERDVDGFITKPFDLEERFCDEAIDISDRKSTRLNSSHITISYAVFCLKKKKTPSHTA